MTANKQNEDTPKSFFGFILLIPVVMAGFVGGLTGLVSDSYSPFTGFMWGVGVGTIAAILIAVGMFGWEWIEKEANKGKLLPFLVVGVLAGIAVSGLLAVNLGKPSCEERSEEPRSSCIQYADDGYEVTSDQKWSKFWSTLPITVIIASLIAIIVRNHLEKEKRK